MDISKKKWIFIIGAPRSGTTWLLHNFLSHPDIDGFDFELKTYSNYLNSLWKIWKLNKNNVKKRDLKQGPAYYLKEKDFIKISQDIIKSFYQKIFKSIKDIIVEKDPQNCFYTNLINKIFPNCKFIHIIRDGRNAALSSISTKKRLGWGFDYGQAFNRWAMMVRIGSSAKKYGKNRYFEIRYEDLLEDTENNLKKIFDYCEIKYDEKLVKKIAKENSFDKKKVSAPNRKIDKIRKKQDLIWKKKLNLKQRYLSHVIGDKLLKKYGYIENENWWKNSYLDYLPIALKKIDFEIKSFIYNRFDKLKNVFKTKERWYF